MMAHPLDPPARLCDNCERPMVIDDEPPNCYFTGRGHCGDCRDPRTNRELNCFTPYDWWCVECRAAEGLTGGWELEDAE